LRVARPTDGLTADHQLLVDIRGFQISHSPDPTAEVEFSAKILGNDGQIADARIFRAAMPVKAADAGSAANALDAAFGKAVTELVLWAEAAI